MSTRDLSRRTFLASTLAGVGVSAAAGETEGAVGNRRFASPNAAVAEAWRQIEEEGACRVIVREREIVAVEHGRGVGPFVGFLDTRPQLLKGAVVVDSVMGLASAAVAVQGGVSKVLARTASESARGMLARNGIPLEAKVVVPHIMNRKLTGVCPLEADAEGLDSPEEILATARGTLAALRRQKKEVAS